MRRDIRDALISAVLNYIYPSQCPSCSSPSDSVTTAPFCRTCWSGVSKYQGPSCAICALPFSSEHATICGACLKKQPFFSKARSYGIYENTLAAAINMYKFRPIKRLGRPLGKLLLGFDIDCDGIIPVPLSVKSLRERGFNQSLLLARTISKKTGIPLLIDSLMKTRETHPQVGLSAKERAANLRGAYFSSGDLSGKRLLLIDDVMTTGATANECSRQLLRAGAEEVEVLTLARARAY